MSTAVPRLWRNIQERYNLLGVHCEVCGEDFFPTRRLCPNCRRKGKLVEKNMPQTGKIYSYTKVFGGPEGFEFETPYYLAVVELENGVRVLSQIVDSNEEKIKTDTPVKAVFRRIQSSGEHGAIAYGFKFKAL
ncbi:Zn-ribbon domain-containing OB-fold protein [Candidatus Micrarchaeota archaeon]|nr:Zn-ribbon domain-containing OB-fold protein [Candidatus Micrarchaeota archaeon]